MDLLEQLIALHRRLRAAKRANFGRSVSFGDLFTERDERAAFEGFGPGTTVYDNVLVLGAVSVGAHCWIGPNVILDGSGGLTIGDHVHLSAGVQVYSHDTVARAVSGGSELGSFAPTTIGSRIYVGPNTVISKGVTIGDGAVIGAMSLVNRDIPAGTKAWGIPAQIRQD